MERERKLLRSYLFDNGMKGELYQTPSGYVYPYALHASKQQITMPNGGIVPIITIVGFDPDEMAADCIDKIARGEEYGSIQHACPEEFDGRV